MKRRKFLQILGLGTVAPVLVGTCSYKSKPPKVMVGIDFGNSDKSVYWEGNDNNWINYEFSPSEPIVEYGYYFPDKPIYPVHDIVWEHSDA